MPVATRKTATQPAEMPSARPYSADSFPTRLIPFRRQASMTQQALAGLAGALRVSLDQLVFDEERRIVKALLERMIVKHQTKRLVGNLSSQGRRSTR